jgi:hypothetical protein
MSRLHEQMAVRAADLAERIVDEISESDQDWRLIERHARELVELLCAARPAAPDAHPASLRRAHALTRSAGHLSEPRARGQELPAPAPRARRR